MRAAEVVVCACCGGIRTQHGSRMGAACCTLVREMKAQVGALRPQCVCVQVGPDRTSWAWPALPAERVSAQELLLQRLWKGQMSGSQQ